MVFVCLVCSQLQVSVDLNDSLGSIAFVNSMQSERIEDVKGKCVSKTYA